MSENPRIGEIYQEHIARVEAENDRLLDALRGVVRALRMAKERDEHFEEWSTVDNEQVDEALAAAEVELR